MSPLLVLLVLLVVVVSAEQAFLRRDLSGGGDSRCAAARRMPGFRGCTRVRVDCAAAQRNDSLVLSTGRLRRRKRPRPKKNEDDMRFDVMVDGNRVMGMAVFVSTKDGRLVGNIPDPESAGSYWHVEPCADSLERDCHVLTNVSASDLAKRDAGVLDVLDFSQADDDRPFDGEGANATTTRPDGPVDPQCDRGKPSEDYRYCCPSSCSTCWSSDEPCAAGTPAACCGSSISRARKCDQHEAPCYMVVFHTVSVAYTKEARESVSDMEAFVRLALAETNAGYQASQIPIELQLRTMYETNLPDVADSGTALRNFQASGGRRGGNMAILLMVNLNTCGRAFLDCTRYAADNCAYAVANVACATGYYSFGHELAHIAGADHNEEASSVPMVDMSANNPPSWVTEN